MYYIVLVTIDVLNNLLHIRLLWIVCSFLLSLDGLAMSNVTVADGNAGRFCRIADAELIVPTVWDNGSRILPSVNYFCSVTYFTLRKILQNV